MKTCKFFYVIDKMEEIFYSLDPDGNINPYPSYEDMMEEGVILYGSDEYEEFKTDLAEVQERLDFPYIEIVEEEVIV